VAAHGNGKGHSPALLSMDFRPVEIEGRRYVELEQTLAVVQGAESALATAQAETAALQQQLVTLQGALAGARALLCPAAAPPAC